MRQKMSAAKSIINKQGSFSSGVLRRLACFLYRGSPTSTVSTSTISTSTNFSAIGIKFVLVELLCSKIRTSGNWLCSTH